MDGKVSVLKVSTTDVGLFLLIFACWTADSILQLVKYFHGLAAVFVLAGALSIAAVLAGLRWLQLRQGPEVRWAWFLCFWIVLAAIYLLVYPIAQRHVVGVGSDREDGLRLADLQLLHFHFPYYIRTFLGNVDTPLPGALVLAIPFLLLGRVSLQNPVWLAAFIFFCVKFFRFRSTALACLIILVFGGAGVLDDFVVGGDYPINVFYICFAVFCFLRTYEKDPSGWQHILAAVLLGLTLSSRTLYVVIPPLILAYLLQQGKGTMVAIRSFSIPIMVAAAITVPIYLYDPAHFTPFHVASKLNQAALSPQVAHLLLLLLPTLALMTACLGFFLRLNMSRVFLLAGLSSAVILLPPGILLILHEPFSFSGLGLIGYSEASGIFLVLWALHRFEDRSVALKQLPLDAG